MNNKKIKIFFGAFSNSTNAQNIYCRGLAINLDKSKLLVSSLNVSLKRFKSANFLCNSSISQN